jgi:hypothetical protein
MGTDPMTIFAVSDELIDWAKRAGYVFPAMTDPGTVMFRDTPGAEIRNYIRLGDEGWLTLTSANRAGGEQFEIACASPFVMERYLWGDLGYEVRSLMHLPPIRYPTQPGEIAPGYWLGAYDAAGFRTLHNPDHDPVMKAQGDEASVRKLVLASHYLAAPLAALIHSFEDPAGRPLFDSGRQASELQPPPGP